MSASCGIDAERCKAARLRRAAEGNQERIEVRDLHMDTAFNVPQVPTIPEYNPDW